MNAHRLSLPLLAAIALPWASALAQPIREIAPVPGAGRMRPVTAIACDSRSVYALTNAHDDASLHRWDGERWRAMRLPADVRARDIGAPADGQLVVASSRRVLRWDGAAWYGYPVDGALRSPELSAVHAFGPTRIIGVGFGRVYLRDGPVMRAYDAGTWRELEDVWGSSPDDVWAVGQGGTVMRWNGASWRRVGPDTDAWLCGVNGSGPTDVWVWGNRDTRSAERVIYRWDGERWHVPPLPPLGARQIQTDGTETYALGAGIVRLTDDGSWEIFLSADDVNDARHLDSHLCRTESAWVTVDRSGLAFAWDRRAPP